MGKRRDQENVRVAKAFAFPAPAEISSAQASLPYKRCNAHHAPQSAKLREGFTR
jgi:hypothetical protein